MAEVALRKSACLALLTLTLVTLLGGCNAQGEQFNQDPLPSRSKFSAQLKEQNLAFPVKVMELPAAPTTRDPSLPTSTSTQPPESVTAEPSLWEMMKQNFNQGLNLKVEDPKPEESNSVYAPSKTSHLSSSWDWASKLGSSVSNSKLPTTLNDKNAKLNDTGDRSTRDAGWGWENNHQTLAWDTAKIVGNVGRGLLSSWWTKSIVRPNLLAWPLAVSPLHGLISGGGWGKSAAKVVHVHDTSLLERWIRAKFSITQHLLLAKLRLHKALITSTIPGAIALKLNLVNYLLKLISHKDIGPFFKTLRLLRQAIWRGKQNLWWRLISRKVPSTGYGVIVDEVVVPTSKPVIHYGDPPSQPWVSKLPEVHYGDPSPKPWVSKPEVTYGGVSPKPWISKPVIHYGDVSAPAVDYGSSSHLGKGQQETILSYHSSKPIYEVQQPSPQPWTTTLKNPLYAFPSYEDGKHESQYAAYSKQVLKTAGEDYATLPPVVVPHSSYSSGPENVVVSRKFLRDLMQRNKGDEGMPTNDGETHSPKTRSNPEEEDVNRKTKQNKFSDQLRIHSGFSP